MIYRQPRLEPEADAARGLLPRPSGCRSQNQALVRASSACAEPVELVNSWQTAASTPRSAIQRCGAPGGRRRRAGPPPAACCSTAVFLAYGSCDRRPGRGLGPRLRCAARRFRARGPMVPQFDLAVRRGRIVVAWSAIRRGTNVRDSSIDHLRDWADLGGRLRGERAAPGCRALLRPESHCSPGSR